MGNTHSMNNNMSLLDQKRYQAEFLRYSQIPYESQYHQQQQSIHASNMNLHQFNKYKEQHALANPVKVLPDVNFESKLRSTNNGAILHSGGTISGRKEESGLHRSKSISETQNTYLSNPNGMPAPPPQYKFQMPQRASTQLSINLQQPMRGNLNKNFGSSHDLKSPEIKSIERRQEKSREVKKGRAPPPPLTSQSNNRIKMTPPPAMQAPEPPMAKAKIKAPRMFGDTLTKNHQNSPRNIQSQPERESLMKPKEIGKPTVSKVIPAPAKPSPVSKINPVSYLRRERTFDMTLMQTENKEKFKPKFSPQFQRKKFNEPTRPAELRQMSTQERYRANILNRSSIAPNFQSELQSATKVRRSLAVTNAEKMRTIDKKPLKKPAPVPEKSSSPVKNQLEQKKSSDNSAISTSNPTVSASSSFKYSKPKQYDPKEPEIVQYHRHGEEIIPPREPTPKEDIQHQMNNFYFGMQEASVDTDNDDENENEADQAQMEAINRFAEDIFKMSAGGSTYMPSQVSTESIISDREVDSDSSDILLNLRPTLPRRQLTVPRFSPIAAWKSLLVDTNSNELKNSKNSSSLQQLHNEEVRQETKIERIYREPSFSLHHLDNKSGDSGISADKEMGGNSPDGQMPPAYLLSSWTPQQDLEEDEEESVDGDDKESYHHNDADKGQFAVTANGHMFSLSLPRDNHSVSDKTPQNNFYSLQKFRKSVADVFGSISNVNDSKVQIQNYGVDSNWLLSSQPNSIDELSPRKEGERNQIISKMTSGKHVMYLPTNYDDHKFESAIHLPSIDDNDMRESSPSYKYEDEIIQTPTKSKSKSHKFKFQSTIRQVERRKIAEKLSREAEEKEQIRLSELEAMQKVEEEFQRKRAREKNMIRQQLRIASLEEKYEPQHHYNKSYDNIDDEIDTRTPYISRIIEAKSPKITTSQYKS